jgi:hypothetical protein
VQLGNTCQLKKDELAARTHFFTRFGIEEYPSKLNDLGTVLGNIYAVFVAGRGYVDDDVSVEVGGLGTLRRHVGAGVWGVWLRCLGLGLGWGAGAGAAGYAFVRRRLVQSHRCGDEEGGGLGSEADEGGQRSGELGAAAGETRM